MTFTYTLTPDEETALNEILGRENRNKEVSERKSADALLVKFIQGYLKIHVDKVRARKVKTFIATYDTLGATEKEKIDKILRGEV
jgi:hypothetical protein